MNKKTLEDLVEENFKSLRHNINLIYDNNDIKRIMLHVYDIINAMSIKIEDLEEELKKERLKNSSPNPQYFTKKNENSQS